MKTKMILLVATALGLVATVRPARADTFNFDELANGSSNLTGPFQSFTPPGPLIYYFATGTSIVFGDVLVTDGPPGAATNGDLLRFFDPNPGSPPNFFHAAVAVYSEAEPSDPPRPPGTFNADIAPFPTQFETNLLTLAETGPGGGPLIEGGINGLFGYTPTSSQPGFVISNTAGSTTYNFTSDVPEPGSFALLGVGAAGLGLCLRRRARACNQNSRA